MKVLLDIDDTLIDNKDNLHPRYKEVINNHDVTLFSASGDIKMWAKKLSLDYISKNENIIPEADVLIDDTYAFMKIVKVKHYFPSIDSFLNFTSR